jgi:hypothetical protein
MERQNEVKHRNFDFWCVCRKSGLGDRSTLFLPDIPQKPIDSRTYPTKSITCLATTHRTLRTIPRIFRFWCVASSPPRRPPIQRTRTLQILQSITLAIPHADQQLEKFCVTQCVHKTRLTTYRNCLLVSNHLCGIL